MAEITIEAIAKAVERLLKEETAPIKNSLAEIEQTLDTHTRALDQLLREKQIKDDEKTVMTNRFKRLEEWAKRVGDQLGIKLDF